MAMDADRRREVVAFLREREATYRGWSVTNGRKSAQERDARIADLFRDAANALEEMGEARELPDLVSILRDSLALKSIPAPKPSAASMEERIRALEDALRKVAVLASTASMKRGGGWSKDVALREEALRQVIETADRALHPHASWCRDPSHDGPCLPESGGVEDDS